MVALVMLATRLVQFATWLRGLFLGSKFGLWIVMGIGSALGALIGKSLKFLGVSLVASKFAVPAFLEYIAPRLLSLPADWVAFLALARIDECIGIMLAALVLTASERVSLKRSRTSEWQTIAAGG